MSNDEVSTTEPVVAATTTETSAAPVAKLAKCDRPSKEVLDRAIEVSESNITKLESERAVILLKIDGLNNLHKDSPLGAARAVWNTLKAERAVIMKERGLIFDRRDAIKAATDSLINDAKKSKDQVKYTSLEQIEKKIKELHIKQSTQTMSLQDEKKLIKEIEELSASKKVVGALAAKEGEIGASKLAASDVKSAIAEKTKLLTAVNEKLDAHKLILDKLSEKEQGTRGAIPELLKERDAIRAKVNSERKDIKKARDAFKRDNNLWYEYQKQVRVQKDIEYHAEKKRREDEKAAWLKEKEEEELKKTPYEEEMMLCEYLANFLGTTYLGKEEEKKEVARVEEVKAVTDDPFAAFAAVNKKSDDTFLQLGKGSKSEKIGKKEKKAKKAPKAAPFNLSIDTYDQFALLNLVPPMSLAEVGGKVKELEEKKEWYTKQERGSVETAADIRKKQQAANKKLERKVEKVEDAGEKKEQKKSGAKGFTLSSDDFAPLTEGGVVKDEVSWGKKEAVAE